jgi:hypothetical protein
VNIEKKKFNCFRCDFNSGNYDVFDFVAFLQHTTRGKAMLYLLEEYTDVAPSWEDLVEVDPKEEIENAEISIKVLDSLPTGVKPITPEDAEHWNYLITRGLTAEEIVAIKTHVVGRRILMPIYGGANNLVSWQARAIDPVVKPKYITAPGSDLHKTLWPYVPPLANRIVLVEGMLDALAVRRVNFTAYATFGKKISKEQIKLLKNWGVGSVVLFWDKRDAKKDILSALEDLKLHFNEIYVPDFNLWPSDKDAGNTLNWVEGRQLMETMLTDHVINIESMDFLRWQIQT